MDDSSSAEFESANEWDEIDLGSVSASAKDEDVDPKKKGTKGEAEAQENKFQYKVSSWDYEGAL